MSTEKALLARSNSKCELCGSAENLSVFDVPPDTTGKEDNCILACALCISQIDNPDTTDVNHWRCLNDCMWSQLPTVQVISWRMLTRLAGEGWPQDLLDMLYLDDATLEWAKATGEGASDAELKHFDSNGMHLQAGDNVTLIKDLNVKGGGFTAKRGTAAKGILLVRDNPEHIEGKINGQQIIILTKYVKKN